MTVIMSNLYLLNNDMSVQHLLTGLIGVFSTRELAMKAWDGKMEELGIPDWERKNYEPDVAGRTMIIITEDGKYIDGILGEYVLELMSIDTEMEKVLGPQDSTINNYT